MDDQRKLSDLTDLEIADLTQKLKANTEQALVGPLEPISALVDEYEGAPSFLAKISGLEKDGWSSLRRTRGDGDCYYRSFAFAYVERLIPAPPESAARSLAKVESLLPLLDLAGFAKDIYDDFYEPLRDLLTSYSSASSARPSAEQLLASFNDPEISNAIVVFLRLLTSAYMRANEDDFVPFLFSLEDDPRFFEGGVPTLDQFCGFHVEAVNKEADHIQITALSRALGIHTRIAYLDQSGFGETSKVDFHEFESESEEKLACALLYRPGHYDCLYR